jgi:hypothetical protein
MLPDQTLIAHTHTWLTDVVIGCNFCPFAAREVAKGSLRYAISPAADTEACLEMVQQEFVFLDENPATATTLLILPQGFAAFDTYLDLVRQAERLLKKLRYTGVYQIASFHPDYQFAGAPADDAANYTNRSPYPMLHLLREAGITEALAHFPNPEKIPERNMAYSRKQGEAAMRQLRAACMSE